MRKIKEYGCNGFYKNASVVISNRLHALLIGASYGAVPLALVSKDVSTSKIRDVFESSVKNLSDSFISDYSSLENLKMVVEAPERYSEQIVSIFEENRKECRNVIKQISMMV